MRLCKLQEFLTQKGWKYTYTEMDGLGSVDFISRGLSYHVWEFLDGEAGVESNVRSTGKQEDFFGSYEDDILAILQSWE